MSPRKSRIAYALLAVAAFHLAYEVPPLACLMGVFLFCLYRLACSGTPRLAFWTGLGIGVAISAPQLAFFWSIFGLSAGAFWLIAGVWIGVFLLLARGCTLLFPRAVAILLMPVLWTGIEYFRSELYYLRFAWLSPGFAFGGLRELDGLGVYGIGFLLMMLVAAIHFLPRRTIVPAGLALLLALAAVNNVAVARRAYSQSLSVVGVQTEGFGERQILDALDRAIAQEPHAELFILSEYAFASEPPPKVLDWCATHKRYLIVGGIEPPGQGEAFRDTAFVVGPDGTIVFSQGKCVPIQFFADGLPAKEQRLWVSPWGKIGICICYDLSYSRVTDELVRMGAQYLIVPTMDAESWGSREHELHARVAPVRAAEYGLPIARIASSGISQIVDPTGRVTATAGFPGPGAIVAGRLPFMTRGHLPPDRILAPLCVTGTGGVLLTLAVVALRRRLARRTKARSTALSQS